MSFASSLPVEEVPGFPSGIRAAITSRGPAQNRYGFNLAAHTGDDPQRVEERRAALAQSIGAQPHWLNQVHGRQVVHLPAPAAQDGDACVTHQPGVACAVMVADCLPVLMSLGDGRAVAAAHAGWRGLAAGVLEASLDALLEQASAGDGPPSVTAWLGPCIGPEHFEIGQEVVDAFGGWTGVNARHFGPSPRREDRWHADLQGLAMAAMLRWSARKNCPIQWAAPPGGCTFSDTRNWFSYRREGVTGRMAALIWRESL